MQCIPEVQIGDSDSRRVAQIGESRIGYEVCCAIPAKKRQQGIGNNKQIQKSKDEMGMNVQTLPLSTLSRIYGAKQHSKSRRNAFSLASESLN